MNRTTRTAMSNKIAELRRKGTKGKVAVAIAYSEARKGGVKRLRQDHPWHPVGKQKVRAGRKRR